MEFKKAHPKKTKNFENSSNRFKWSKDNEFIMNVREVDKDMELVELQMTQTNLVNDATVIPEAISKSLSTEMNKALKLALNHSIQALSNPQTQDNAIINGKSSILSTKHFEF